MCGGKQEIEEGENESYAFGAAAMQGWRTEMVRPASAASAALSATYAPLPTLPAVPRSCVKLRGADGPGISVETDAI